MIKNIFGFPIFISSINENNFNKKELIYKIEENYKKNKDRNLWDNRSYLHHSFEDNNNSDFTKITYEQLLPLYKEKIIEYLNLFKFKKEIDFKFEIVNYTCMTGSQHMRSHHHNNSDFSAVHYLKFNNKIHKPTVFENTNPYKEYIQYLRPKLNKCLDFTDISNSWATEDYYFEINENDICFSPSYLFHNVPIQPATDETRICIVLNIEIE
jgi:hypothetical protein